MVQYSGNQDICSSSCFSNYSQSPLMKWGRRIALGRTHAHTHTKKKKKKKDLACIYNFLNLACKFSFQAWFSSRLGVNQEWLNGFRCHHIGQKLWDNCALRVQLVSACCPNTSMEGRAWHERLLSCPWATTGALCRTSAPRLQMEVRRKGLVIGMSPQAGKLSCEQLPEDADHHYKLKWKSRSSYFNP